MRWPQITMVALYALSLGLNLANHGKPRPPYSFWSAAIATAIEIGILVAGGFFS